MRESPRPRYGLDLGSCTDFSFAKRVVRFKKCFMLNFFILILKAQGHLYVSTNRYIPFK